MCACLLFFGNMKFIKVTIGILISISVNITIIIILKLPFNLL